MVEVVDVDVEVVLRILSASKEQLLMTSCDEMEDIQSDYCLFSVLGWCYVPSYKKKHEDNLCLSKRGVEVENAG